MVCDSDFHSELKIIGESSCPFCCELLKECDKLVDQCCDKQDILEDAYSTVCQNCGSQSYKYVSNYIDFYENMYKIRRKSIYQRKYHVETVLNNMCFKNRIDLTHDQRDRIYRVFAEISDIIPTVNYRRKRLISTKYITKQIFMLLGLPFEFIKVSKSKKTLQFYNRYWAKILLLKSDKIIHIMK